MITMTVDSKQLIEESKQKGFLPSPPMTEAEDRVMPQQDEVEAPGQEGLVGEVILPGPGYETGQVILVVPAFTDSSLVFRFCYKLREIEGVEIASFNYSSKGTIIKLALLNPLLQLLVIRPCHNVVRDLHGTVAIGAAEVLEVLLVHGEGLLGFAVHGCSPRLAAP